jgi:DNA invertase Pin-like site-specific DNA recombinase
MTVYGYARVSTTGQSLATQEQALAAAGVDKIFAEKVSGATGNRRALERVLEGVMYFCEGWV